MKKIKVHMVMLCILSLCVAVSMIGGCSGKGENASTTAEVKEKLVLWSYYETDAQQAALDKLIQDFNRSQADYEANWEYVPMTEFTKRLAIGITEEELPDLVIIDNPDMKRYINLGMFEDISTHIKTWEHMETYEEQAWNSVQQDGSFYGIPFCCNNLALIYNKSMMEKYGMTPPEDWETFVMTAKKLSSENTYGFAMSALDGEQCSFQVLPWILAEGEEIETIGTDKTKQAYEKINMLIRSGYLDHNCVNWSQVDIARKFINGEAAMMENGPWVIPMLRESGIDYGVVPLPFGNTKTVISGGENLGVMKGKNIKGAIAFLEYYNQDEVMADICKTAYALPPKLNLSQEVAIENQEMSVFAKQMEHTVSRASFEDWSAISDAISNATYAIFTGTKTPEEVCKQLQKCEKKF